MVDSFFCILVHCCYGFRIKLIKIVYVRFKFALSVFDWLINLQFNVVLLKGFLFSNHNQICHWCLSSMLCQPIFVHCLFYHSQEGEVAMSKYHWIIMLHCHCWGGVINWRSLLFFVVILIAMLHCNSFIAGGLSFVGCNTVVIALQWCTAIVGYVHFEIITQCLWCLISFHAYSCWRVII